MIQQLNPTIPVVTPKGKGNAIGWIDYGMEDDLYWIVFQTDTCECWIHPNKDIRAQQNLTLDRKGAPQPLVGIWAAFEAGHQAARDSFKLNEAMENFKKQFYGKSPEPKNAQGEEMKNFVEPLTTVPAGRPGESLPT